jgi:hypothetical protein
MHLQSKSTIISKVKKNSFRKEPIKIIDEDGYREYHNRINNGLKTFWQIILEDFGIDMDRWTLDVEEDSDGNAFITLPPEVLEKTGWKEGDRIKWTVHEDGGWQMEKVETAICACRNN